MARERRVKAANSTRSERGNTSQHQAPVRGGHPNPKPRMRRDWGLLVSDQDILDLIGACNAHSVYPLAARFVAILDAITNKNLGAIDRIAKERRAGPFRKVVSRIKQGLAEGEEWSARYTARAVIAEAFRYTPPYFHALDAFTAALREKRASRLAR